MTDQENLFNPAAFESKRTKKSRRKENKAAEVDLINYTIERHGKLEVYIPLNNNLELAPEITFEATRRASVAYQNSLSSQTQPMESLLKVEKKPDERAMEEMSNAEAGGSAKDATTSAVGDKAAAGGSEKKDGTGFDIAGTTVRRRKKRTADTSELGALFTNSAKAASDKPAKPAEATAIDELTYDGMLAIIFKKLNKKREDTDNVRTLKIEPQVDYQGVKKTLLLNFEEICSQMHRAMDHVLAYLSSELRQQTTIDQDNNLSFKTRISAGQFRTVIKAYLHEYVQCHACSSYNTLLSRDGRMYLVQCEDCSASRTVPAISRFSDD